MNELTPISQISFGTTDGKNEARNPNFESLFYDGGGYYRKLKEDPLKFLVIGRKGTGKTILVRYFQKILLKERNVCSKFIVAGDFTNEKLNNFDYMKVREEEREIFWRYVILKELASLVLKNESGFLNKKHISQLRNVDSDITLNLEQLIQENNESLGGSVDIKNTSIEAKESIKNISTYATGKYFNKIGELTESLMNVMKKAKKRYFLFFDDLDEIKLGSIQSNDGESSLIVLAKLLNDFVTALAYVNDKLLDIDSGSRIISTLRKDVAEQMQFYGNNINKIITDNGINITWFSTLIKSNPQQSDLGKLIIHKIKASVEEYKSIDDKKLFDIIFLRPRKKSNPFKFIVERGFGRPRDVIKYLDIVQDTFLDERRISYSMVRQVQSEYCSWFYSELRNEINILENSKSIVKTIDLIKKNGKVIFNYDGLTARRKLDEQEFTDIIDLKMDLKSLFILGAIGNHKKLKNNNPIIEYSYRDGANNPDFSNNFVVHQALRNYLSIGE